MFGHDNQDDQNQNTQNQAGAPAVNDPMAEQVADLASDVSGVPADNGSFTPPSLDTAVPPTPPPSDEDSGSDNDMLVTAPSDDLVTIKQQALQQLSPLVGHLDQTPEEKFRTTMMMIQASDDQNLIKTAYEAAQQITDDKTRAQALLDIVNEINYFTHQQTS